LKGYIFDIDGTLADVTHRLHFLKDENWDGFYEACDEDAPIDNMIQLFKALADKPIRICTGRRASCFDKTRDWIWEYCRFDICLGANCLMRANGDRRPDSVVKPGLLSDAGISPSDIICIFEDRASVVKAFRNIGYTVCQVADGNF
jgi:hypothetical protein